MWSRNGTPVFASPRPAPSSLSVTVTEVSRVLRSTSAVRFALAGASRATGAEVLGSFRNILRLFCISIPARPLGLSVRRKASKLHRARMALEPFHPRQVRDRRSERGNRAHRRFDYTGSLEEIVCAQGRREARGTARRQHVIRARKVVAERRRRERSEKNRAGRLDLRQPSRRIAHVELEMLRPDLVGQIKGLI